MWLSSLRDSVKINVDATYNPVTKFATLGMVVRDSIGTITLRAMTKIDNVESPLHAEFQAILFGLEVARSNSFLSIMVESDFLLAIQEILKQEGSFCE